MRAIELPAATIEYEDTGGAGRVVVLLHGLLMDSSLWASVMEDLSADHRCIAPTLPLGAHRIPATPDADLSLPGIARLTAEFLDRLGLDDVIVAGNDTGGALVQLLATEHRERIAGIVLVSCDAYDNFPPGLTGKALVLSGKLPPVLFGAFMQQMRWKPLRRLPVAFGWLTRRGDAATRRWLQPVLTEPAIRRDTIRVLRSIAVKPRLLVDVAEKLGTFDRPALVVWASEDRVMPSDHGHRLADALPQGQLIEIADSDTLIPLDQPARLAESIRAFTQRLRGMPRGQEAPGIGVVVPDPR